MDRYHWEFWIDQGGTFTDVVTRDPDGKLISNKLLSDNPSHYQDAVVEGVRQALGLKPADDIPADQIRVIKLGTTMVTNALLERKGERVLLAITEGFADALRIGYQNRPDLFALDIVLPSLLYDDVIEIIERVDARGQVIRPLNEDAARQALKKAYARGYRAIAIVLMHGYQYRQHEKKLGDIARAIGFTRIAISHAVAPVMKLVPRGETTVVEAYLATILQGYIQSLRQNLGVIPLFFMQSNGGLAAATAFQSKDSIFSGPAGGVVGMIKTSRQAGFQRVIGFDMGGTSTDVSHYAGEYERVYAGEVNGIRLHTPMMRIHTIAAGGGSIIKYDSQRYTVGPESAGANPGPACYRRNGPLTITDCNVMVGKIHADFFPKVFGPQGNEPLDSEVVKRRFEKLAETIRETTGRTYSVYQVAEGFLNVAVENMANAIKKISLQRGYDVTTYVLNCFGGASGQHACLVADALRIPAILIHPLAGVLSAYGIGLANVSVIREHPMEKPLQRGIKAVLQSEYKKLEADAVNELASRKGEQEKIRTRRRIHLRYQGSDTVLVVDFAAIKHMRAAFHECHRMQFGFASGKKALVVEAISVECDIIRHTVDEAEEAISRRRALADIPVMRRVPLFTHNDFHEAPVYERSQLIPGDCIPGCAIICEANATTIVEPGWQAKVTAKKHLILTRYEPLPLQTFLAPEVNPVMLEVFNNRFMNIAEQMGEVLRNTATSVNIKERLDFSCAVFDAQGELVANAPHIPVHLGSMSESVKNVLRRHQSTMNPGDVYMLNDPYHGGTHLPDITIVTPVFDKQGNTLLFLLGSRGHHADIGGMTPGSMPAASKRIQEEGVLLGHCKVMDRGRFQEQTILRKLRGADYPARNPKQNLDDLKAQIAANSCGEKGLMALVDQFGVNVVQAYMRHVRDNAALSVQRLLARLQGGQFCYSLDDGSLINVSIVIDQSNKRAVIDFTGSAPLHSGNFNAPVAITQAAVLYVLRCLVADQIPLNSGCFAPVELIIPPDTILNPDYPAAVVAGNVETSQCIVDTLLGALGVVSASQGTCNNITFGNERYQYYETICGGAGAGPEFDGASAVHTHMTNTRLTDPEVLEWRFPVLLEQFAIRKNSGGAGKHRGGDGVVRRIRFLEAMEVNIISSHRNIPPYGLYGGAPGLTGRNAVQRADGCVEELGGCAQTDMRPGDILIIKTPGGGGYGKR
ncbi:hydantoinase B/oxoprolinase family protein [Legionella spiritensis]|uniref:hydantoinase B/oxoprolinase family protein n=1 Tax=Legionella spiritensis TaxID=452 RepID=UPI000F6DE5D0|nr:hydantoinase B/oxoprolinase family protein [Legionella spiritensis]VEG92022.1 Acetone carboxylase beta subunit [Legionella spiritensis]